MVLAFDSVKAIYKIPLVSFWDTLYNLIRNPLLKNLLNWWVQSYGKSNCATNCVQVGQKNRIVFESL